MNDVTWNDSNDYMSTTTEPTVPGDGYAYRAKVETDFDPEKPEFDVGCPVLRIGRDRRYAENAEHTGYGADSAENDGISTGAEHALDHFRMEFGYSEGVNVFDRYLRIFHGGSALGVESIHRGDDQIYVTYDTRAMRESWGQTGEMLETSAPNADEWQAYIDGDVYIVSVERAEEDGDDWEQVGDGYISGFFGQEYAKESALEELESVLEDAAENPPEPTLQHAAQTAQTAWAAWVRDGEDSEAAAMADVLRRIETLALDEQMADLLQKIADDR